jgi:hypothetical protein
VKFDSYSSQCYKFFQWPKWTVLPATQIIAHSFNIADKGPLPWALAAYGLTFGKFILASGRLGDIFGHKNRVIAGFGWMALEYSRRTKCVFELRALPLCTSFSKHGLSSYAAQWPSITQEDLCARLKEEEHDFRPFWCDGASTVPTLEWHSVHCSLSRCGGHGCSLWPL